jgi:hypothetical protein
MKLRVHAEAEAELQSAALYYESCQEGLGQDFSRRVTDCIEAIANDPHRFPRYEGSRSRREFRRAIVERFPYEVVYQVLAAETLVIAIAHAGRRPAYWKDRGP